MKQPEITVTFSELAATAIERGERGIIAMILKSDSVQGPFSFTKATEVPSSYSEELATQIKLAFMGYINPPRKVIGYILKANDYTYSMATPDTGDNPSNEGWYEKNGSNYVASTDTVAKSGTTYYEDKYTAVTPAGSENPSSEGWFEKVGDVYVATEDETVDGEKTYYAHSYDSVASVDYADNPKTSGWYELVNSTYTASNDTYPLTGKVYYIKSGSTSPVTDYTVAYDYLKGVRFQYLVVPTVATDGQTSSVVSFIKEQRSEQNLIKAVLPDTAADSEGIVNVTTSNFTEGETTYTAEQYCSRIAGIIAGTPLTMSATYAPLAELDDCSRMTRSEADAAANAGQFVALWDGEKVKMGRAINSLTTTTQEKNNQFKKIKLVDAMDMISDDIRKTIEDSYIGKYANTYSNKIMLITAISNYFDGLMLDSVIGDYTLEIDVDANEAYLKGRGIDTSEMSQAQLRSANTGSYVYLKAVLSMIDAIEDVILKISI